MPLREGGRVGERERESYPHDAIPICVHATLSLAELPGQILSKQRAHNAHQLLLTSRCTLFNTMHVVPISPM
jgi:uncharacterized lipoprotein YbaY